MKNIHIQTLYINKTKYYLSCNDCSALIISENSPEELLKEALNKGWVVFTEKTKRKSVKTVICQGCFKKLQRNFVG